MDSADKAIHYAPIAGETWCGREVWRSRETHIPEGVTCKDCLKHMAEAKESR
jgi:hypothetical protein